MMAEKLLLLLLKLTNNKKKIQLNKCKKNENKPTR